jgi:histidyl-tRNA synthetase
MAKASTQPARGMRDFLPSDVRRREYVIGVIREVYERFGFEPLETPSWASMAKRAISSSSKS